MDSALPTPINVPQGIFWRPRNFHDNAFSVHMVLGHTLYAGGAHRMCIVLPVAKRTAPPSLVVMLSVRNIYSLLKGHATLI